MPAPLPPDPPIRLEGELRVKLSRADRALGRLDGSVVTLPNPDLFVFMFVREEAVFSSQIEGTQSSLDRDDFQDLKQVRERGGRHFPVPGAPHDVIGGGNRAGGKGADLLTLSAAGR